MNPYSHIVIAARLEQKIDPEKPREYYWGTVAPDIRYLAAIQRQRTHVSSQRISELIKQYPQQKSFLQGYLVHCILDDIDLGDIFFQHFPYSILKNKLSRQQIAVIFELYLFENVKVNPKISNIYNEVLSVMGLSEPDCDKFSKFIDQYIRSTTFDDRIQGLVQLLGLENDPRIERYISAAKGLKKHKLSKKAMFMGIRSGKISEEIAFRVSSLLGAG